MAYQFTQVALKLHDIVSILKQQLKNVCRHKKSRQNHYAELSKISEKYRIWIRKIFAEQSKTSANLAIFSATSQFTNRKLIELEKKNS